MVPQDEYRTIREGAAIGSVGQRRQIAVAGKDRATYLQGLLTNDILALGPGTGCYAAWLTPQGRMLTDLHVLESGAMILLDVPAETLEATLQRLEQFIFTEDVQIASLSESLSGVWLHGPQAAALVDRVLGLSEKTGAAPSEWPDYRVSSADFDASPVSVVRIDQLGVPGFCVYVERVQEPPLVAALEREGAVTVSAEAIESARIEAGYPRFGIDMTDDTIPLEAGIEDRGISTTKGCYVGQEVIIRVLHRGQGRVVRRLVGLRIDGAPPSRGARLYAADRDIGFVTSAAESPRLGTIALGYVHRDFLAPGTKLEAQAVSGRSPATVTERLTLSEA
jgi:tRNA-modifying protein YgfZ